MVMRCALLLFYSSTVIVVQADRHCQQSVRDIPLTGYDSYQYLQIICRNVNFSNTALNDDSIRYQSCCRNEHLVIYDSNIPIIPPSTFLNFPSINKLYLNGSNVKEILPNAFNFLDNLKELYLSGNNLTKVPAGVYNSLVNLLILDLSKNNIQEVHMNSFVGMLHLQTINLSQNALKYFSNDIFNHHLLNIEKLDLSNNQLSMFNFTLATIKIHYLNLTHNRINKLEGCFTQIRYLDLSTNELSSIKNINCTNTSANITYLNLAYNSLTDLNIENLNMNKLEYLNLQNNNITSIPNGFFAHLNLTSLNLSYNKLAHFQYGLFDSLHNLKILDISNNQINAFEKHTYHSLNKLKELYLQYNKLSKLDYIDLSFALPNLTTISLEGNNFTCEMLVNIFHKLRLPHVINGHSLNSSNIHGIACSDIEDDSYLISSENSSNAVDISVSKLSQFFNGGFMKSGMYKYFNEDFKNSDLFKYLEKLNSDSGFKKSFMYQYFYEDFKNSSFYKYLENQRAEDKSNYYYNQKIKNYFENDFKNTSFVKYLDNLNKAFESIKSVFSKSGMYNYFNSEFKNSNFYKYLEALKTPLIIKYFGNGTDPKAEQLISTIAQEKDDTVSSPMVIIILLLITVVCLMGFSTYMIYTKLNIRNEFINEQVELMEA